MAATRKFRKHKVRSLSRQAVIIKHGGKDVDILTEEWTDIKEGDYFYILDGDGSGNSIPFQNLQGHNVFCARGNGYLDSRKRGSVTIVEENSYFELGIANAYIADFIKQTQPQGRKSTIRKP